MCAMLCVMLSRQPAPATLDSDETACAKADAATAKQIDELRAIKKQRYKLSQAVDLKPWMQKVKKQAAQTRAGTDKALKTCKADERMGPRGRQAAISRLKKRLRELDETDDQMTMMQAFEGDPNPRIDPSVLRVLER